MNNNDLINQSDVELETLRSLLLGEEYEHSLKRFGEEDSAVLVADVLKRAIERCNEENVELDEVLSPNLYRWLANTIESDADGVSEILYPVMWPAIREAVRQSLDNSIHTMNEMVENSLRPKYLWWRLQAWRSGRSFSEYYLLKTLDSEVEQVLLIERETGLLVQNIEAPGIEFKDPEMVSSMLSAINDFAIDSLAKGDESSLSIINSVKFGELTLEMLQSPTLILVAAIRGSKSSALLEKMTNALVTLHDQHGDALKGFDGDTDKMTEVRPVLLTCLAKADSQDLNESNSSFAKWILYGLFALIPFFLTLNCLMQMESNKVVDAFKDQPGYLVSDHHRSWRTLDLSVITNASVEPAQQFLDRLDVDFIKVDLNSAQFGQSNGKGSMEQSLRSLFDLDDSTVVEMNSGVLYLSGNVNELLIDDISRHPIVAQNFAQVHYDPNTSQLSRERAGRLMMTYATELNGTLLEFKPNSVQVSNPEDIQRALTLLKKIDYLDRTYNLKASLYMTLFDQLSGDSSLSIKRGSYIRSLLKQNQINLNTFTYWGADTYKTNKNKLSADRLMFNLVQLK